MSQFIISYCIKAKVIRHKSVARSKKKKKQQRLGVLVYNIPVKKYSLVIMEVTWIGIAGVARITTGNRNPHQSCQTTWQVPVSSCSEICGLASGIPKTKKYNKNQIAVFQSWSVVHIWIYLEMHDAQKQTNKQKIVLTLLVKTDVIFIHELASFFFLLDCLPSWNRWYLLRAV